ncbi:hypothetical protein HYZ98_00040 [Candidatus Peregrinibacteria bacterium]|nr:hypothetical protein [Candidatus Peregrinibacteria bacterium]
MKRKGQSLAIPEDIWIRSARIFIGLFFVGLGLYKLYNYFLIGDLSLKDHFQFWLDSGYPPAWYAEFLRWGQGHHKLLAAGVVAGQFIPGAFIALNWHVRPAAVIILFLQINVGLGVLKDTGFNDVVGISLWAALFYILAPRKLGQWETSFWRLMTLFLIVLAILHLYNRYNAGDPWVSSVAWHRIHLEKEIMSITPFWKNMVLAISATSFGSFLIAAKWWVDVFFTGVLITRWRLYGALWLTVSMVLQYWTWLLGAGPHAVLWVLVLFAWMTHEEYMIKHDRYIPLLPWKLKYSQNPKHHVRTFFGLTTLTILTTMMFPPLFGLQGTLQWGGVYTDFWCNATVVGAVIPDPEQIPEGVSREYLRSSMDRTVWYGPMHSPETCLAWSRSWCGTLRPANYIVQSAFAYRRGAYLAGKANLCLLPPDGTEKWFKQ